MLRFFTDTDTDITPEVAAKYNCSLISMPYSIDGKNIFPYVDFKEFDFHAFYDQLRSGVLPTTSAVSEEQYIEYFEPVFAAGDDILYVHFSAAMSASFAAMDRALARLKEKYPERKFYGVDTKGITTISYAMVIEVGEMLKAGRTPKEIVAWADENVDRFAMYFFVDDLKFFKHSGRVGGLAATMGTLLGVRPIINMNSEGKMVSCGKERGRQKAIERLLAYVDELGDDPGAHPIYIGHSDYPEVAEEISRLLKEKYGPATDITIVPVNPTAGSHCGPNGVGVCFRSTRR